MKLHSLGNIPVRLDIPPGQQILYDNRIWTYRGRAADRERRLLFEDANGLVRDLSDQEFLDLLGQGALKQMGPAEVAAFAARHGGGKPWVVLDACVLSAVEN